jgi:outer membrane lipoprotein SlyB
MNTSIANRRSKMTNTFEWRRGIAALCASATLALAACNTPPAFQVTEQPAVRIGTVESITQDSVQNVNNAVGMIGGALVGGGLGSLIGGGTGQTVATIVGAGAGAWGGNQLAQRSQTLVWKIGIRYDDGTFATVQQTSAPALRIGDRVQVTSTGIQLLR